MKNNLLFKWSISDIRFHKESRRLQIFVQSPIGEFYIEQNLLFFT